jgi:hypothetical protein
MSLFGKKEKEEIARLNAEMQSLRDAMPSESRTLDDIIVKSKLRVKNSLVYKNTLKAATAS